MSVNFDFGHSVMDSCNLNIFRYSILQPAFQDGDLAPLFELIDKFFHRHCWTDDFENLLNVAFLAFELNECAQNYWDSLRVLANLKQIDLDVFREVILIEITGKFVILLVSVTEEDDWFWVSKFKLKQNIFHFYWVIAISLTTNHLFDWSELAALGSSFNILVMNLFVSGWVDNGSKEEENTVERSNTFKHLHDIACSEFLKVLHWNIDDNLKILTIKSKHFLHAG